MRMYFCAYCTNVVASCCNVFTANMTACKLQCLHKTLRLGASFETNIEFIVLGEPEWCQKRTKIPLRDFEEALIFLNMFPFPSSINIHCLMRSLIHPSCSNVRSNGCSYEWFDTGMHPPTLCEGEGHLTKRFCIAEHGKISYSMVQPFNHIVFRFSSMPKFNCKLFILWRSTGQQGTSQKSYRSYRFATDGVKCWLILSPVISIYCFWFLFNVLGRQFSFTIIFFRWVENSNKAFSYMLHVPVMHFAWLNRLNRYPVLSSFKPLKKPVI